MSKIMSKRLAWFKMFGGDFLRGARGLTDEEVGVYIKIICLLYEEDGHVKNNVTWLSRAIGTHPRALRRILAALIAKEKIIDRDELLSNARVSSEVQAYKTRKERAVKPELTESERDSNAVSSQLKSEKTSKNNDIAPSRFLESESESESERKKEIYIYSSDVFFEKFWEIYPKKACKLAASKAWPEAVGKVAAEDIIAAVSELRGGLANELEFIPHPATWLNGERWNDPLPEAQQRLIDEEAHDEMLLNGALKSLLAGGRYEAAAKIASPEKIADMARNMGLSH